MVMQSLSSIFLINNSSYDYFVWI